MPPKAGKTFVKSRLYAEGNAIDPRRAKTLQQGKGGVFRVAFQGDFRVMCRLDEVEHGFHLFGSEQAGRTAAKINGVGAQCLLSVLPGKALNFA